jgi:hypothetical protein
MPGNASGFLYISPKHFRLAEMRSLGMDFSHADMGREIRCIDGSLGRADMLHSATYIGGAEMQAAMFHVAGLETHHGTQHSGIDFRPLDSFSS